jgi:hypothetical protein
MSIGGLATLGKIAGVGGIALGAVVLLGDKLIGTVGKMPAADQAAAVHLITIGLFGIGALGLVVWVIGSWSRGISASSTGDSSPAIVAGGNVGVNAPAGATPAGKGGGPGVPHGAARTRGLRLVKRQPKPLPQFEAGGLFTRAKFGRFRARGAVRAFGSASSAAQPHRSRFQMGMRSGGSSQTP